MRATQLLHAFGQSLWLDNITRDPLPKARRSWIAMGDPSHRRPLADRHTRALRLGSFYQC